MLADTVNVPALVRCIYCSEKEKALGENGTWIDNIVLCLDSLSVQTWPFWYCILFLFLPRWVMSIEIKKIEEKMAICHLLYVQVFHYLLFSLLHSVPPHLLFGYIRFAVILHLLAGITSRVCKEPPSGAGYQSCMFSLHLPSLPLWLVDKFFGCTCFHGLIVSTDLQQYLC